MPVEIVLFGAVLPTLLPVFGLSVMLYLIVDKWTSRWDLDCKPLHITIKTKMPSHANTASRRRECAAGLTSFFRP